MYIQAPMNSKHTHTHTPSSECVFVQVNVMSVISQGFDYRLEETLCSQAVREAAQAPAQAPQPFSQLTTMPVKANADNSMVDQWSLCLDGV